MDTAHTIATVYIACVLLWVLVYCAYTKGCADGMRKAREEFEEMMKDTRARVMEQL